MKKILILLLFFSFTSWSKEPSPFKKHTNSAKNIIAKKRDTIYLNACDTAQLIRPANDTTQTNIYLFQQGSKNNLFKDILPILTLLLGIAINKFLDWLRDRRKITKAGERWVAEIRGLESPIKQQIDSLRQSVAGNFEKEYQYSDLGIITTLNCEIFKSMDKSDLLKYIERHKKNYPDVIKVSNRSHGFVSILTRLYDTLQEKYKEYINGSSKHISTVNENLQALSKAFANYGLALERELGANPIDDRRYRPIQDLFDKYIEPHRADGAFDLFELDEHFFQPLIKILADLRHDERTIQMSDATLACINGIKGIRMEKRYWKKNTLSITDLYSGQLSDLKNIADEIENRKA